MRFADDDHTITQRLRTLRWSLRATALLIVGALLIAAWLSERLLQRHVQHLQKTHASAVTLVQNRDRLQHEHQQHQQRLANLRQRHEQLLERVPATASESEFLSKLSELAEDARLTLRDFRPGTVATHETHAEREIQLRAEGHHDSLCQFLAALQKTERLNRVSHLQIGPAKPPEQTSQIDIHVAIAFDCKLPTARPSEDPR
jgi:Tfp pilus assembly protein PilO